MLFRSEIDHGSVQETLFGLSPEFVQVGATKVPLAAAALPKKYHKGMQIYVSQSVKGVGYFRRPGTNAILPAKFISGWVTLSLQRQHVGLLP